MRTKRTGLACSLVLVGLLGPGASAQDSGRDATRSVVTVIGADGKSKKVVFESSRRFDAPNWSPDGSDFLLNAGGKLWKVPAGGGKEPQPVPTGSANYIDINHGISPDGKTLAVTAGGAMFLLPGEGGDPRLVAKAPSYFHGWSPDGKTLVYTANRGRGYEIFGMGVDGDPERPLAPGKGTSDSPDYSADGRWIYFNTNRSGNSEIWRIPASKDGKAERVFGDDRENWAPRPSPDGKWLIFLSYPRKTAGHPSDRDVTIRRLPLPGAKVDSGKVEDVVRFVGGHGSIGARPWSPDGRRFAYVSYNPPPPSIRVVFFTPADLAVPAGAPARLTKIADSTERFFFDEMKRNAYPPSVGRACSAGNPDGSVEVIQVKGDQPVASGKYAKPDYAWDVIQRATRQYQVAGEGHVWWIFIYVGDRPTRFNDWRGVGCVRDGGWAMVNYDTIPGEIRPDIGIGEGFNAQYFLKGTIHELGHAFGLHHVGPDVALGMGNTLMGPNNSVYAAKGYSKADQVYLSESEAARLWKHPIFSGTNKDRVLQPAVKLLDYKPRYSRTEDRLTIAGKLVADQPAHSVVVVDDRGKPGDEYWFRGHAARLAPDGTFKVEIAKPAKADGHLRIMFCFDNGMVTGDGAGVVFDDPGEIRKSYRYRDGKFQFGD